MLSIRSLVCALSLVAIAPAQTSGTLTDPAGTTFSYARLALPCHGLGPTTLSLTSNPPFGGAVNFLTPSPGTTGLVQSLLLISLPSTTVTPLSSLGLGSPPGCALGMDLGTLASAGALVVVAPNLQTNFSWLILGMEIWPVGVSVNFQPVFLQGPALLTGDAFTITRDA